MTGEPSARERCESTGSISSSGSMWFHTGKKFLRERCIPEAIRSFNRAQELGYPANECAGARWHCWMLSGSFERAWHESDLITATGLPDPHRFWNGEAWEGERVMLRCLHGLGDTIQFIRYAPLIARTAKRLVAQVHPQLVTLIRGVPGISDVCTWDGEWNLGGWDMQMEVTELPRAFRTTLRSVPGDVPYIQIPEERMKWARQIIGNRRSFRVGLTWECGSWNNLRSVPLSALAPVIGTSGCDVYALQKGCDSETSTKAGLQNIELLAKDVLDTAALMQQMDLIISTDTMSAHLAGALARPVWVLLPFEADWRWMLDRQDTPWYPTARLFRQRCPRDWDVLIREIAVQLHNLSSSA